MELVDQRGDYIVGGELPLATRKGRQIPNDRRQDFAPGLVEGARAGITERHPRARSRSRSSIYNCVGMVFGSRRTVILPLHVSMILDDDEFRRYSSKAEAEIGDVVVYKDETGEVAHVGIIVRVGLYDPRGEREIDVLSQWGAAGEYFHEIDDVDRGLGEPTEFWTDRT